MSRTIGGHHDDIHVQADHLRREAGKPIGPSLSVPELNDEILALGVAQLAQSLFKGLKYPCRARITGRQYADPGNFRRLSFNSERRENETDSENDRKPDPPHTHLGGGWLAGVYQRKIG